MAELKNMVVDAISLVKAGANGEPIQIYKSAEGVPGETVPSTQVGEQPEASAPSEAPATEPPEHDAANPEDNVGDPSEEATVEAKAQGILARLFDRVSKSLRGELDPVEKAQDIKNYTDPKSFSDRITDQTHLLHEALDTLQITFYNIFWDDTITNGRELILRNVDEFKTYITKILDGPQEDANIFFKGADSDMTPEAISQAVAQAIEPLTKSINDVSTRLLAMEKAEETTEAPATETGAEGTETGTEGEGTEAGEPAEGTEGGDPAQKDDLGTTIAAAVAKAMEPLLAGIQQSNERLDTLEKARGISRSAGTPTAKSKSADEDPWAGVYIPGIG